MYFIKLLNDKDTYNTEDFKKVISDEIKEKIEMRVEHILTYIDNYDEIDAVNVKMYVKELIDIEFNESLLFDLGIN